MTNLFLDFDRDRFYIPEIDDEDTGEKGGESSDDTDEEERTNDEDTARLL